MQAVRVIPFVELWLPSRVSAVGRLFSSHRIGCPLRAVPLGRLLPLVPLLAYGRVGMGSLAPSCQRGLWPFAVPSILCQCTHCDSFYASHARYASARTAPIICPAYAFLSLRARTHQLIVILSLSVTAPVIPCLARALYRYFGC